MVMMNHFYYVLLIYNTRRLMEGYRILFIIEQRQTKHLNRKKEISL